MQIDRQQFLQEQELRLYVRRAIKIVQERYQANNVEHTPPMNSSEENEEERLRQIIRRLLAEDVRSQLSTGMKELETLLKKIIPQLEDDYKLLTTDPAQRESFRAHIIHAVQNTLSTVLPDGTPVDTEASTVTEAEINVDIEDDEGGEDLDGFIPVRDQDIEKAAEKEEKEDLSDVEKFGIEGKDLTGRNMAFRSYKSVEKVIADSYALLGNEEDRNEFYDYLITNLKLHFDKFEDELADDLSEPSTPAYEKEKEEMSSRVDIGDEPGALDAAEEDI